MGKNIFLVILIFIFSGCQTLPARRGTSKSISDLEQRCFEIENKQNEQAKAQAQILETMHEMLKMLSELYSKK